MSENLNEIQLKAADLIARGFTEMDVADMCGKSRAWIQKLKKDEIFQTTVAMFKKQIAESIRKASEESIDNLVTEFRGNSLETSRKLTSLGRKYLALLSDKVETMTPDDIPSKLVPNHLKIVAEVLKISQEIHKEILGIDQLVEELSDIHKMSAIKLNQD
ncbi:MAG: hypothetical protein KME32_34000 [Mojavia pulchra JT2-VF2]|jgi:uncharacterized membrane protein YheB (UPF0754 family)|uniref:Uncharacterized protein n=1 Tax=Mojavia pulchra JT2-VF2 TaxID=287848 RepID=A0A951Q604_9NOST|nr:hypothetical protein [Mojavia pulchra JT2-VF2]